MKDEKMTEDALHSLKSLRAVEPSAEARKLALNAALVAFDAAQAKTPAAKKTGWLNRWSLGAGLGLPLGTAAAALILFPLGTQLYTTTSLTSPSLPPVDDVQIAAIDKPAPVESKVEAPTTAMLSLEERERSDEAGEVDAGLVGRLAEESVPTNESVAPPSGRQFRTAPPPPEASASADMAKRAAPAPELFAPEAAPIAQSTPNVAAAAPSGAGRAPSMPGGFAPPAPTAVPFTDGDNFQAFDENGVKITAEEPVSTFSIDVDTASYSYVRSLLEDGYLPEPDAVRLEELINYFPYDYPAPDSLETPFKATMAVVPTPWNPKTDLVEIGIKGYVPPASARQPQNLTFLIDTSGSMDEPNKLPLLKRAFGLLVDTLKPGDMVSIVAYAGSAGVVLEPISARNKRAILGALDRLDAGGSTAGAEGIALAYELAGESRIEGGVNRVILATDGDFNVGIDDPDELKSYIKTQRDNGIFLSVLGFGRGNLDDALMQALAQNGNGNASYIDSFAEARKVLVEEGGANLVTIAKDVKIQVEFNPAVVSEYRLIGYETRALNREDFNNDAVDAGEIGAGHTVTAIYEITPVGSGAELNDPLRYSASEAPARGSKEIGYLKMRYKAPEGDTSQLIETPISTSLTVDDIAEAGNDQRFAAAVAAFGQKLKSSSYGETMSWGQIADLANGAKGADENGYRAEFVQLIRLAATLEPDRVEDGARE